METFVDTVRMRECGRDIIRLSEDFRITMDTMFDRINNMPINTREWVGSASVEYAMRASREKSQYMELRLALYSYGNYLIECANHYEASINRTRRNNG